MSLQCFAPLSSGNKSSGNAKGLILCAETFYTLPKDRHCSHGRSVFFGGFARTPAGKSQIEKIIIPALSYPMHSYKKEDLKETYECISDMLINVEMACDIWKNRFFVIDTCDSSVPRPSFMQSIGGDQRFYAALKDIHSYQIWQINIDDFVYIEDDVRTLYLAFPIHAFCQR